MVSNVDGGEVVAKLQDYWGFHCGDSQREICWKKLQETKLESKHHALDR